MFSCEFCELFKNIFLYGTLPVASSVFYFIRETYTIVLQNLKGYIQRTSGEMIKEVLFLNSQNNAYYSRWIKTLITVKHHWLCCGKPCRNFVKVIHIYFFAFSFNCRIFTELISQSTSSIYGLYKLLII